MRPRFGDRRTADALSMMTICLITPMFGTPARPPRRTQFPLSAPRAGRVGLAPGLEELAAASETSPSRAPWGSLVVFAVIVAALAFIMIKKPFATLGNQTATTTNTTPDVALDAQPDAPKGFLQALICSRRPWPYARIASSNPPTPTIIITRFML